MYGPHVCCNLQNFALSQEFLKFHRILQCHGISGNPENAAEFGLIRHDMALQVSLCYGTCTAL